MITKVLSGHTSPETAYVVDDYPYGFRLRCSIRYWIETKPGHGQRVVSQTTNPKKPFISWNAPKPSTYSNIRVLFLDEHEHVANNALSFYDSTEKIDAFVKDYSDALTSERDQKELRTLRTMARIEDTRRAAREGESHAVKLASDV